MSTLLEGEHAGAISKNLLSFAAKTLNTTEEDLASVFINEEEALNEGALNVLLERHSSHIKTLQGDPTAKFKEGHQRGLKDAYDKVEKHIREKYSLETDGNWTELLDAGHQSLLEKSKTQKTEITAADVEKHELYMNLMKQHNDAKTDFERQLDEFKQNQQKAALSSVLRKNASNVIDSLKLNFDADPTRAANQKAALLETIEKQGGWKLDGENLIPTGNDGTALKNEQGYPVASEDLIKSIATSYYSPIANDPHKPITPANNRSVDELNEGLPRSMDEFLQMTTAAKTSERRAELLRHAQKQEWYGG